MVRIFAVLVLLVIGAAPALDVRTASADDMLQQLRCVAVRVVSLEGIRKHAMGEDELRQIVIVGLRAKLPRLAISASCSSELAVWANILDISSDRIDGIAGVAEVSVRRAVTVTETRAAGAAEVWSAGVAQFHGPKSSARRQLAEFIDRMLTKFAAQYYEAGNP